MNKCPVHIAPQPPLFLVVILAALLHAGLQAQEVSGKWSFRDGNVEVVFDAPEQASDLDDLLQPVYAGIIKANGQGIEAQQDPDK